MHKTCNDMIIIKNIEETKLRGKILNYLIIIN